jgi:hypothetical protein
MMSIDRYMMSKERESLKRLVSEMNLLAERQGIDPIVYEIEELLAQPEQIDQEPVAWMYEEATSFNKDGYFSEWLPCFYLEKADEDKSLRNETPLYASPPKREPLSYSRTADLFHANKKATNAVCYWAGVSDAEKAHSITDIDTYRTKVGLDE